MPNILSGLFAQSCSALSPVSLVSCRIKNSGCAFAQSCAALCPAASRTQVVYLLSPVRLCVRHIKNSDCLFAQCCSAWCPAESRTRIVYLLSPVRPGVLQNQESRLFICSVTASVLSGFASTRIKHSDCVFAQSCSALRPAESRIQIVYLLTHVRSALCPAESRIQIVSLLSPLRLCVLQSQKFRWFICSVLFSFVSCLALCPAESRIQIIYLLSPVRLCVLQNQEFRLPICSVQFGLVYCRIKNSEGLFARSCSALCPGASRNQIVYLLKPVTAHLGWCPEHQRIRSFFLLRFDQPFLQFISSFGGLEITLFLKSPQILKKGGVVRLSGT